MKILVCMKQVPAGTKVDIDPETGAMKRLSGETRTNPYDLFALESSFVSYLFFLKGHQEVLQFSPWDLHRLRR